ncbi:hypothetical protein ACFQYP_52665 [Nonomuraea antimicrobica]
MQRPQIRPARPEDDDRIRHFLAGLSLHTRTLRFFTGVSVLPPGSYGCCSPWTSAVTRSSPPPATARSSATR